MKTSTTTCIALILATTFSHAADAGYKGGQGPRSTEFVEQFCGAIATASQSSYYDAYKTRHASSGYQGLILLDTEHQSLGPPDYYQLTDVAFKSWAPALKLELVLNDNAGIEDSREPYWEKALSNFKEWSDTAVEEANKVHLFANAADMQWWTVADAKSREYQRSILSDCILGLGLLVD